MIALNISSIEGIIGIDFNTAKGVDDIHESIEIHTEIVIHRNFIEHGQRIHADLDAVNTRVSQFVRSAVGDGQRYIIITRRGNQEYLSCLGIDARQNIDIAAAAGRQCGRTCIASADVNIQYGIFIERRSGGCLCLIRRIHDGGFHDLCCESAYGSRKVCISIELFIKIQVGVVQNDSPDFAVSQAVG